MESATYSTAREACMIKISGVVHVAHLYRKLALASSTLQFSTDTTALMACCMEITPSFCTGSKLMCEGVEHCDTGAVGACQHLQCFRSSLEVCRRVGKQACHLFVDPSINGAHNWSSLMSCPCKCIAGPCLTLEPSKSGVTDRCSTMT